jgi:hypothetical protein
MFESLWSVSHWNPLIDRATTVGYDPLKNNANALRTELESIDAGAPMFGDAQHAGVTLGLVFQRCQEVGVVIRASS